MTDNPLDAIQAINAVSDMAKLMRGFYRELVNEGFSASEALALTMTYLTSATTPPRND